MCIIFLIFIAHWILCTKSSEPSLMYIQALKMHLTYSNPYHVSQGLFKQTLPGFSASAFTFLFTDGLLSSTYDLVPFVTEKSLAALQLLHVTQKTERDWLLTLFHASSLSFHFPLHSSKTKHHAFSQLHAFECIDFPSLECPSLTCLTISSIFKVHSQIYPCCCVCSTHLFSLLARHKDFIFLLKPSKFNAALIVYYFLVVCNTYKNLSLLT